MPPQYFAPAYFASSYFGFGSETQAAEATVLLPLAGAGVGDLTASPSTAFRRELSADNAMDGIEQRCRAAVSVTSAAYQMLGEVSQDAAVAASADLRGGHLFDGLSQSAGLVRTVRRQLVVRSTLGPVAQSAHLRGPAALSAAHVLHGVEQQARCRIAPQRVPDNTSAGAAPAAVRTAQIFDSVGQSARLLAAANSAIAREDVSSIPIAAAPEGERSMPVVHRGRQDRRTHDNNIILLTLLQ